MESERELGSDSYDVRITKVSDRHSEFIRSKLAQYIMEAKDFSAEIHHIDGQPTQMIFSIGPTSRTQRRDPTGISNKILVRNLPPGYDEQHLQMFFEYEKGQGGGPVKSVFLNSTSNTAIIEFEQTKAVNIVLSKRPIKIMDRLLEVDVFIPYLKDDEMIQSVNVTGLSAELTRDVVSLHLQEKTVRKTKLKPGDKVRLLPAAFRSIYLRNFQNIPQGAEGIVILSAASPWISVRFNPYGQLIDLHENFVERIL